MTEKEKAKATSKSALESIKEEKVYNANKVEQKFKVGDWIASNLSNSSNLLCIIGVDETNYEVVTSQGSTGVSSIRYIDKHYNLWTIQDAKEGDILCYKDEISLYKHDIKNCIKQETIFGGFVYYCCYDGKRFITDSFYSLTKQDETYIHPATKEQRDVLMKTMNDAGYEWNAEKKELKKNVKV